ncbi:MAG TPA: hypothetical protein VFT22_07335 [Kofleriaceae bacterium]|nr:hypothetical protein [Kofleriaceae bacterium]
MPNLGSLSPQQAVNADYLGRLTVSDQAVPSVLTCIPFTVSDAATSDIDVVMTEKFEVVDVVCIKRNGAGAGNTMQIKNAATVISDAIACATDNAVTRAASIDDASSTIAAGGTLRLTATKAAGTRNAQVFVWGFIRP